MQWTKEMWAMSILSDAQELISMGRTDLATETINKAKRVLMDKYEVIENGFAIRVFDKGEMPCPIHGKAVKFGELYCEDCKKVDAGVIYLEPVKKDGGI